MYWRFFYKILSLIDPETGHNLIIKIIKNGFLPKIKTKTIPLKVMNMKFVKDAKHKMMRVGYQIVRF